MSAQDVILGARVARVRELKTQLERLTEENRLLRAENEALRAHFDQALQAAVELKDGELEIWDGWNLILGSQKVARDRADLVAQAVATGRRIWIVLDGPAEKVEMTGRVRVSYTGGTGQHRADRLICDFLRMAAYLGLTDRVKVRTFDRDFAAEVDRLTKISPKMV